MKVLEFITPKETKFFDLLTEQCTNLRECAVAAKDFLDRYNSLDASERAEHVARIKKLESKGDTYRHRISNALSNTFITPIDREDIHRLSYLLDEVLDYIHTVADRMVLYGVEEVNDYIIKLVALDEAIVHATYDLVVALEKRRKLNIEEKYEKVHRIESAADVVYHDALKDLFANETEPVRIIKLREIYGLLETVADKAERVADIIESIVIKHG